jgi:hypothetical protein
MKRVYKAENGEVITITNPILISVMEREKFEFVEDLDPDKEAE